MTENAHRVPDMRWAGWGLDDRGTTLSESVRSLLRQALGAPDEPAVAADPGTVELKPGGLDERALADLAAVVGADQVRTDRESRLLHLGGKSTPDLLRRRAGDAASAPDAVLLPDGHEQVLAVLEAAVRHRIAVVPFGGGTSVVGGVEPLRGELAGVVALDLRRMARLLSVDRESMTVVAQPGLKGPEIEELLAARGLTLGHFPQSFEHASLGGFAATRSAGQASGGYGRFDDLVLALKVATPTGTLDLGRAPASAAGPDLRQLFLGSEGAFGVLTELTLRVRPAPAVRRYEAWSFPDFRTGTAALRTLSRSQCPPALIRLSDEAETGVNLAIGGQVGGPSAADPGGCLAVAGYEGTEEEAARQQETVRRVCTEAGGRCIGTEAGEAWREGRFRAPYLRDALLDAGVLAETLETATDWARLDELCTAVRAALTGSLTGDGAQPLVLCHISHSYPSGASLYFTVAVAAGADPARRWAGAKRAAMDAIAAAGATITHHHAVGTDHRDWMTAEVGPLGVAVLRAVKATLDPAGILNPGKLIPPG